MLERTTVRCEILARIQLERGSGCSKDSAYLDTDDGRMCYKWTNTKRNWQQGKDLCESEGGTLPMPKSIPEKDFLWYLDILSNYFQSGGRFFQVGVWLGLTDKVQEGEFVWLDGTPFNSQTSNGVEWRYSDPNNYGGNEHCGQLYNDLKLVDNNCNRPNSIICQKKATTSSFAPTIVPSTTITQTPIPTTTLLPAPTITPAVTPRRTTLPNVANTPTIAQTPTPTTTFLPTPTITPVVTPRRTTLPNVANPPTIVQTPTPTTPPTTPARIPTVTQPPTSAATIAASTGQGRCSFTAVIAKELPGHAIGHFVFIVNDKHCAEACASYFTYFGGKAVTCATTNFNPETHACTFNAAAPSDTTLNFNLDYYHFVGITNCGTPFVPDNLDVGCTYDTLKGKIVENEPIDVIFDVTSIDDCATACATYSVSFGDATYTCGAANYHAMNKLCHLDAAELLDVFNDMLTTQHGMYPDSDTDNIHNDEAYTLIYNIFC